MKNKKRKGFTLVELLVVIAILGILASVTVVGYLGFTGKAKEGKAEAELAQYKTQLIAEMADPDNAKLYVYNGNSLKIKADAETSSTSTEEKALFFGLVNDATAEAKLNWTLEAAAAVDWYWNVTAITYNDGEYTATWTIATDKITSVKNS